MKLKSKPILSLGLGVVAALVILGTFRAYTRGANDFSVFYEAWRLVLASRGAEVYRVSPDRFLYGPGFAWILSPLGLLPRSLALGVWCLAKAFLLGFLIRKLADPTIKKGGLWSAGVCAWGVVLVARPLLIDLEYGQVNLFILGACVWGLLGHSEEKTSAIWDTLRWTLLSFVAFAKLFPLPLLCVPWLVTQKGGTSQKIFYERIGILIGFMLTFFIPVFSLGVGGGVSLLVDWSQAVLARGLPIESHNQSFSALIYHYFSGLPTHVLSEGTRPVFLGRSLFSPDQIIFFSLAWTCLTLGLLLGWLLSGASYLSLGKASHWARLKWAAIGIGLTIVPSHLIWKPYFIMGIPLAVWIMNQIFASRQVTLSLVTFILFLGINFTGFDFIGHHWAAHVESASFLLLMHLSLMAAVFVSHPTQSFKVQ